MGRRNKSQAAPARAAARSLVLSGSLERRVESLARWVPDPGDHVARSARRKLALAYVGSALAPDELKAGPGEWLIPAAQIHRLLAEAHRHAKARRWLAAVAACDTAEALARPHWPAIRAARQRAQLRELEERADGEIERRAKAEANLATYRKGKRKGALDPLARVLLEILQADPYMREGDVVKALVERAKHGDPVVLKIGLGYVRLPKKLPRSGRRVAGLSPVQVLTWRHPGTGVQHKIALSGITHRRLARLRRIARNK